MVKGPAGAIPLAGAAVEFKDATTGLPISFSLYPDNTSPLPLVQPYVTGDLGELEVWADLPHRVQITVTKNGLTQARETIDLEYPPEYGATDSDITDAVAAHEAKDDPHTQYLTQPEGNLRYLPLSHEPGVDPHPQYLQAAVFAQPDPLGQYQLETEKAQPSGYAPLDPNGLLPTVHLPPLAITDTFVVASEAEMLALVAQTGDLAIRSDTGKSYILAAEPASLLTNWKELSAAAPVLSVDGRVGVVDLSDRYVDVGGDSMTGSLTTSQHLTAGGNVYAGNVVVNPGTIYLNGQDIDARYLTQTQADLRYLGLAGGALTGPLSIQSKPVAVSPDAGNILQWLPNGLFAGLSTANVTVLRREEFSPPASSTSVTLASSPTTVLEVSRNGVAQSQALGHYTLLGAVITFADTFTAGEQVLVLYEVGTSQPVDAYTKAQSDARYEPFDSAYTKAEGDARYLQPAAAATTYVAKAGDTMTGTLAFSGGAVLSGGAVVVSGSGAAAGTDALVYGPSSPAWAPLANMSGGLEYGLRFTATVSQYLVAVRWYRASAATAAPLSVRLWDTTSTATPVWALGSTPPAWTDAAIAWKEHRLVAGTQPLLVAGRTYVLSVSASAGNNQTRQSLYTPVAGAGLTFAAHVNGVLGAYPATTQTAACAIDGAFQTAVGSGAPSGSGAVRLPNGSEGAVAWRNAANTADLTFTADASDRYTLSGAALRLGGDVDLTRTGVGALRLDTNLGVGVAPPAWGSGYRAINLGERGALRAVASGSDIGLIDNSFNNGTDNRAIAAGAASLLSMGAGNLFFYNAPSVGAGAIQAYTQRLHVSPTGTLTLTPDAGVPTMLAISGSSGANAFVVQPGLVTTDTRIGAANAGQYLELYGGGGGTIPYSDNAQAFGQPTRRWSTLYAVAPAINTSSLKFKDSRGDLDPARALAAVLRTPTRRFNYTGQEQVFSGYYMEEADELFTIGPDQTSAGNDVGVLMGAIQALAAQVADLKARLA